MNDHDVSPSMRRAWIEILQYPKSLQHGFGSPSMRRAWIEIPEH